ncbi:MAG: TetR/AcrR family transcriptional regulator [Massilia sp.]
MASEKQTLWPSRQREHVRGRLLEAAAALLAAGEAISIGTVAKAAGVSKGAVQYHFGTREQLISALNDVYLRDFEEGLSAADESAPPALQYARLWLNAPTDADTKRWRGQLVANMLEPNVAARWRERVKVERAKDGVSNAHALLVRLAADGLWLSDLVDTYEISPSERKQIEQLMIELLNHP